MLIMPPGHHQEVRTRRAFSRRERGFVGGSVVVLVALVLAVLVSVSGGDPKSGHGCVYATIGSTTGALTIQGCGAKARALCAEAATSGAYPPAVIPKVIAQCRLAGVPVTSAAT